MYENLEDLKYNPGTQYPKPVDSFCEENGTTGLAQRQVLGSIQHSHVKYLMVNYSMMKKHKQD